MNITAVSSLSLSQKERLLHLWNAEFTTGVRSKNLAAFEDYLSKWEYPHHILLLDEQEVVQGWIFIFSRDGGRWFSMLLDKNLHGRGYGSQLLKAAQQTENQLNGWVVDDDEHVKSDGTAYRSPIGFYVKNGFEVKREDRYESEVLSAVKVFWERKIQF